MEVYYKKCIFPAKITTFLSWHGYELHSGSLYRQGNTENTGWCRDFLYLIFLSNKVVQYLGEVASGEIPGSYLLILIALVSIRYLIILTPLAFYIAVGEKQGVNKDKLRGTIQNDILKEYMARGTYIFPPKPSLRLITNIFEYCSAEVPKWNTISISGYHIREAGSTAVQEVAFTLADGIEYVKAALDVGMDVDQFAGDHPADDDQALVLGTVE